MFRVAVSPVHVFGPLQKELAELVARITHSGRSCHEHSMTTEVYLGSRVGVPSTVADVQYATAYAFGDNDLAEIESDDETDKLFDEACVAIARWIYRNLDVENDYRQSDEYADEAIGGNDWRFDEDGNWIS